MIVWRQFESELLWFHLARWIEVQPNVYQIESEDGLNYKKEDPKVFL